MSIFIINADDFGLSPETNSGILKAHKEGVLSSTSVLANMPGFEDAICKKDEFKNIGFGAHLNLNMGQPVLPIEKVPKLVDSSGYFFSSYIKLIILAQNKEFLKQTSMEWNAQLEKLLDHGYKVDHINSQSHVHMIPALFNITEELKLKYRIPHLRFVYEPFFSDIKYIGINRIKLLVINTISNKSYLKKNDKNLGFKGLLRSNSVIEKILCHYLKINFNQPMELLLHPGYRIQNNNELFQPWVKKFLVHQNREQELFALLSEKVKNIINRNKIQIKKFKDLYL